MDRALEYKQLLERTPNFGFTNQVRVEQAMSFLYKNMGLEEPKVICFDSPFQLQIAIKLAKFKPVGMRIENESFAELGRFLREEDPGAKVNTKLWNEIGENAARALKLAFANEKKLIDLHERLRPVFHQVEQAVFKKLEEDLQENQQKPELFAHHPNYLDFKWLLHYQDKLNEIPLADTLYQMLEAGLMYAFNFENLVLWCPLPRVVNFNGNGQSLHSEAGPSLAWNRHFTLYHWHGTQVPRKLIEAPALVRAEDIMRVRNAEVRRCFQEILGSERFASLFDLELKDSDLDLQGNKQFLYRSRNQDLVAKEHLQFAKVTCPTSGRQYFLSVPPNIENVWDAVAWTFGKTAQEYQPKAEF